MGYMCRKTMVNVEGNQKEVWPFQDVQVLVQLRKAPMYKEPEGF